MVKKRQKNLNYSNILDVPCDCIKEVEFRLEVILLVSLLFCSFQRLFDFQLGFYIVQFDNLCNVEV